MAKTIVKDKVIHIRVELQDMKDIAGRATVRSMSISDYVRALIRLHLGKPSALDQVGR